MKRFYKENRVFVILMGIALVCIAIILFMMASYVIKSSTSSTYGNRLEGIKDVEIKDDKITEMETAILELGDVKSAEVIIHGKIIYFDVDFNNEATVENAKSVAVKCLDFFEEDYLNFYDLQFLMTKSTSEDAEDIFPIIGYRKAETTNISWSNNAK